MSATIITTISRIRAFDWYWPQWPWMTLNAVIAFILRFFCRNRHIFRPIITVVEDWPIMSLKLSPSSSLLLLAKTITHPAARSLCDSWASCFNSDHDVKFRSCIFHPSILVLHFPSLDIWSLIFQLCWSVFDDRFGASLVLHFPFLHFQSTLSGHLHLTAGYITLLQNSCICMPFISQILWCLRWVTMYRVCSWCGTLISVYNQPPRSTQSDHPFVGWCSKYQPNGGDALQLGSKDRYDSCVDGR